VPSSKNGKKKVSAKGKLVLKYWNLRRCMDLKEKASQSLDDDEAEFTDGTY